MPGRFANGKALRIGHSPASIEVIEDAAATWLKALTFAVVRTFSEISSALRIPVGISLAMSTATEAIPACLQATVPQMTIYMKVEVFSSSARSCHRRSPSSC